MTFPIKLGARKGEIRFLSGKTGIFFEVYSYSNLSYAICSNCHTILIITYSRYIVSKSCFHEENA